MFWNVSETLTYSQPQPIPTGLPPLGLWYQAGPPGHSGGSSSRVMLSLWGSASSVLTGVPSPREEPLDRMSCAPRPVRPDLGGKPQETCKRPGEDKGKLAAQPSRIQSPGGSAGVRPGPGPPRSWAQASTSPAPEQPSARIRHPYERSTKLMQWDSLAIIFFHQKHPIKYTTNE